MKLTTGLTVSLAVLVTGLYTWGISTDPDGFGGLLRSDRPVEGAVPLSLVGSPGSDLSWKDLATGAAQAIIFKLKPPPVASLDTGFVVFLDELAGAVAARDLEAVLALGGAGTMVAVEGSEELVPLKKVLARVGDKVTEHRHDVWGLLEKALALPVAKGADGAYCAPWFSCLAMPPAAGVVEPFETVFVIGEDVPVHAGPSQESEKLLTLSYDALRLASALENPDWVEVILPANRTGYIARDAVAMMFETRLDFDRLDNGRWVLTSLVIAP